MTEIHSATPQLLDLAAGMRPDWSRDDLSGALTAARSSGWPWPRACMTAVRLLCDPEATPRDLLAEVRNPLARETAVSVAPHEVPEYAAARAELAASLAAGAGESQ